LKDRLARCSVAASIFEDSETIKQMLPLKQVKRFIVASQHYLAKEVESARENEKDKHRRESRNLLKAFSGQHLKETAGQSWNEKQSRRYDGNPQSDFI
jgi:hypothetical protein